MQQIAVCGLLSFLITLPQGENLADTYSKGSLNQLNRKKKKTLQTLLHRKWRRQKAEQKAQCKNGKGDCCQVVYHNLAPMPSTVHLILLVGPEQSLHANFKYLSLFSIKPLIISIFFSSLSAMPHGMCDVSFLARDQTLVPCSMKHSVLTTRWPGKPLVFSKNSHCPSIPFFQISWKRAWQPNPISLLGKSYGQRSLVGYSP